MPYGYHAPYGIFICFLSCRFIDRRNTPIFFAFFTFFSLSIPFLSKMTPFSPPFCPLHTVFTDLPFQNSAPLLSISAPSSKNETIFFAFFAIMRFYGENFKLWNHISRLFYSFIFTSTLLNLFLGLRTCHFTFFETIFFAFFAIMRFYGENFKLWNHISRLFYCFIYIRIVFAKMKPYSSPFSTFSIVFTISCLKTCLKTRSPLL